MSPRILQELQGKVRAKQYIMTLHAQEEMEDDSLTVFDVEHGVLSGNISEKQKDLQTGETKYVIQGTTISDELVTVVGKIGFSGKLVIITVYRP